MKKILCIIIFTLIGSLSFGQSITDAQFFDALDLNYAGLESVKACVKLKNYSGAQRAYVQYLKQRTTPKWYFDWNAPESEKRKTGANIAKSNRYANNELISCGIWHQFGKTIDWTLNPTENHYNEWTWQLNRHEFWISLGYAYWNTGNEKYAKAFVSQINSWIEQCKRPKDDGNYPGSPWRTMEAGLRMRYSWPNAFFYFLSSPSFDDEAVFRMVKSFYEHALFLYDHRISKQRLSHEMNGLYTVGVLFPEFRKAAEWRSVAAEELYREEVEQFYPDGSQKELAPSYHGTNLSCIVSVYQLAKLNHCQLPQDYESRLENIYSFYSNLRMPDGKLPAVNDSRWFESSDNLKAASELFQNRKDFAYLASGGKTGREPSYTSVWMPWAGWYVMRSGWDKDAFYALFEVGPYGIGHQHEDKLSFVLAAYGSLLITECGNYAYDSSQWRRYALSARGHNVARVDGFDQIRSGKKNVGVSGTPLANMWVSNRKYDLGEGYYTEGFGGKSEVKVTHHRTLKFVKNKYWLLTDEFIPSDEKEHTYDIWFHLNTDKYKVDKRVNAVYSTANSEANIAILRLDENRDVDVIVGQTSPEVQGWVADGSSDIGFSCRPVATPIYHNKKIGAFEEYFVLIPFRRGENVVITQVKRLSSRKYKIYMDNGQKLVIEL